MDNQKYLVIITLIDGQNFAVPSGTPEKIEASVFAEARFGNESVLRSDPIKLTNSNPEFSTELAWQLDKKNLHQLRVERKAIKLQVFMQTKERKKLIRSSETNSGGTDDSKSDETHKVELIGYTILDLRSAQPIDQPSQYRWCPLLNPKFRKSSYNRPEIQLSITLKRLDDEGLDRDESQQFSSICSLPEGDLATESLDYISSESHEHNHNDTTNGTSRLYTTCLDVGVNNSILDKDEIIDNDIIIRSREGITYVYDANSQKSSLEDCTEKYRLCVKIPFCTGLDALVGGDDRQRKGYYFSINLFGSTFKTMELDKSRGMTVNIMTTHPAALATYFELNSNLDIRFHRASGDILGLSTIQLNQLCSLDLKCRSIEGVFTLLPSNDYEHYLNSATNPSIGVSVVLEKVDSFLPLLDNQDHPNGSTTLPNELSCDASDEQSAVNLIDNTHQVTLDDTPQHGVEHHEIYMEDHNPGQDDHHYRFTIDLKKFSYTTSQRLIPMLRELVISYSYYWFGYVDKITTDASIPINATSSIIVSGFCEFNFASTSGPLLTALSEIPLNLEILAADETRLKNIDGASHNANHENVVATCSINLANILGLSASNINYIGVEGISKTSLVPIFSRDGEVIGELQLYLCLKDLGKPAENFSRKASFENLCDNFLEGKSGSALTNAGPSQNSSLFRIDNFIAETKRSLEEWKETNLNKLDEDIRRREVERFKRITQRIEAKEAKRDSEFRKKLEDLNSLEKKFLHSLENVNCLEKMLTESIEHLKTKNAKLDERLNTLELKISQTTCNGHTNQPTPDKSVDDSKNESKSIPYWARNVQIPPPRRAGCNLPVRSSSLVRAPEYNVAPKQVVVRRATGPVPTSTNLRNVNSRVRSNSARISLPKETLDKLTGTRKEKTQQR